MAGGSSRKLGLRRTRRKIASHGVGFVGIDRLSDLPDNILVHILSFLNTKCMVRTSLLARRWRWMWKNVRVLNFESRYSSSFEKLVGEVLSHRGLDSAAVSSVTLDVQRMVGWKMDIDIECQLDMDLFDRVMKYAAAAGSRGGTGTGCQRDLRELTVYWPPLYNVVDFSKMAASITAHGHHKSLDTVKLAKCSFQCGDAFGLTKFKLLTTLELIYSRFSSSATQVDMACDPFVDLPRLKHLKLICCESSGRLKISGLQLLDLEIVNLQSPGIEIVAPKLKSLLFHGSSGAVDLIKWNLRSLDCVNIIVPCDIWNEGYPKMAHMPAQKLNEAYMKLSRELRNAISLNLRFDSWCNLRWEELQCPFTSLKSPLQPNASPYVRLKIRRVQYSKDPPIAPYKVIQYIFEDSPNKEEHFVNFEKGPFLRDNGSRREVEPSCPGLLEVVSLTSSGEEHISFLLAAGAGSISIYDEPEDFEGAVPTRPTNHSVSPYQVICYFAEGSPKAEGKFVKFEDG